jgi:cell division protease FtsH
VSKQASPPPQAAIDAEIARLVREAEERATGLLRAYRGELGQLVELLLEHETVDGAAVYQIAGQPAPVEAGGQTMAPRRVAAASPAAPAKAAARAPRPDDREP